MILFFSWSFCFHPCHAGQSAAVAAARAACGFEQRSEAAASVSRSRRQANRRGGAAISAAAGNEAVMSSAQQQHLQAVQAERCAQVATLCCFMNALMRHCLLPVFSHMCSAPGHMVRWTLLATAGPKILRRPCHYVPFFVRFTITIGVLLLTAQKSLDEAAAATKHGQVHAHVLRPCRQHLVCHSHLELSE